MPPDMKHIILSNLMWKFYSCTLNSLQGSATEDLKGVIVLIVASFA